jgi:S-formylglutathione hydrolase FrmB
MKLLHPVLPSPIGWVALVLAVVGCATGANAGRVLTGLSIQSATLGRAIPYTIYIPDVAVAPSPPHVPALYLLHGRGDDEMAWISKGDVAATLDRKITAGDMQPMIVVMPGAGNSWYVDDARSSGYGAFATAFMNEFVPAIDRQYPTLSCRAGRAIGGLSMGGYGAVIQGLSHPDHYAAVFSLSGSLFSEDARDIETRRPAYGRIFEGVFGEPFDTRRFLDWNVFMRLDRGGEAVAKLPFWLLAGDNDFSSILSGTVRFHQELRRRGHTSELRVVKGGHDWVLWSDTINPALSWLSGRLKASCGGERP